MTKIFLADQIFYRLEAGYPAATEAIQYPDILAAINQRINVMFKMEQFSQTFAMGETIPDGLVLATYSADVVTFGGKKSKAILPVMPVSLTRNMGIYEVADDEFFTCPFIPLQPSQASLLKGQDLISDILGQTGYEVYGNSIITTKDITIGGTNKLWFRLVVMDINSYDDYTDLPIPADMGEQIVMEVYKLFVPVEAAELQANGITQQPKEVQK